MTRTFSQWLAGAAAVVLVSLALLAGYGCAVDPPDPTTQAQADPMHWEPQFNKEPVLGHGW